MENVYNNLDGLVFRGKWYHDYDIIGLLQSEEVFSNYDYWIDIGKTYVRFEVEKEKSNHDGILCKEINILVIINQSSSCQASNAEFDNVSQGNKIMKPERNYEKYHYYEICDSSNYADFKLYDYSKLIYEVDITPFRKNGNINLFNSPLGEYDFTFPIYHKFTLYVSNDYLFDKFW